MILLLTLVACAPALRMPGPLTDLGRDVVISPVPDAGPTVAKSSRSKPGATAKVARPPAEDGMAVATRSGAAVSRAATSLLGRRSLVVDGARFRYDCSGFAAAALAKAGITVSGSTADLWASASAAGDTHRKKRPAPGDLAYFDDTYDRNGNGRNDDALSHVAVVESVDEDGTITMVHLAGAGVVRLKMNLLHPHDTTRGEQMINEPLRARSKKDPPGTSYLASELWVGFSRPADRSVAEAD